MRRFWAGRGTKNHAGKLTRYNGNDASGTYLFLKIMRQSDLCGNIKDGIMTGFNTIYLKLQIHRGISNLLAGDAISAGSKKN
jgi:hypothetical protein